ncbi:MAG: helix-turn-helix domain-containing protein [Bacteroidales bacterium]|jgi:transposase-like protein
MTKRSVLAHQMLEHAARHQKSGKNITDYSKQFGIARNKLQYWIRKYKEQEVEKESSLKFIELSSFGIGTEHSKETVAAESTGTPQITLTFPNGMCLKIY